MSKDSLSDTDQVLIEEHGNTKKVLLNRPKALNALSLPMIRKLTPLYKEWCRDPKNVVIMKGAGDKAFCAGGDIRAIYDSGKAGEFGRGSLTSDFFYEEYNLNYLIAKQAVTQVSLLNGITLGGGVGLSVHGKYRVATESTLFAMPETAIGFFPDVGASYALPRLPGKLGMYLGLTGDRIKGQDLVTAGIATHFVPGTRLSELEEKLSNAPSSQVRDVIQQFAVAPDTKQVPEFVRLKDSIDSAFGATGIPQIFSTLESYSKDGGNPDRQKWAARTLETLRKMSPTSLFVTHAQLKAPSPTYLDCFKMEYTVSQRFVRTKDFFEGVRSTLVDKDKNPRWDPPSIENPDYAELSRYFENPPEEWEPF